MNEQTKTNLTDRGIWARGLYMIIFAIAYAVAETVATIVVIFQFLATLITGHVNAPMQRFGQNLARYIYQLLQFQTFNSEELAFPFSDWPDDEPGDTPWREHDRQRWRRKPTPQQEPEPPGAKRRARRADPRA